MAKGFASTTDLSEKKITFSEIGTDLYAFTLEPQLPVDFEVANHYVSTYPQSRFVRALTVQRVAPEERYTLVDRELAIERASGTQRRTIATDDELLALLSDTFGLDFPRGTRFRLPAPI